MKAAKYIAAVVALGASIALMPAVADTTHPSIISFDHGSLDTLDALGLGSQVMAVPKQSLPDYLSHYGSDQLPDAGGLKSPDLEVIRKLQPDLVLVTGRQGEITEEIQNIAKVRDVGMPNGSFTDGVTRRVMELAELFDATDRAERALENLWAHVEQQKQTIEGSPKVLVVTHNTGNFSLRQEPVITELLALAAPAIPEQVESVTRGTRTFTPLTTENIVSMAPDVLLVVDRSAAIGDEPLDKQTLEQQLGQLGGERIKVDVLSPGLWYLSGGGLQSVRLQVDEVIAVTGVVE